MRNRGKHPNDDKIFGVKNIQDLTAATDDLCWLLSKDYAISSALSLVGNRYKLNKRQRAAVGRIVASDSEIENRKSREIFIDDLEGKKIEIDGFNLLIILESALSGAYIFKARDSTYRDISSVHGSYKKVIQTKNAIQIIGRILEEKGVEEVKWILDAPVSNSGRLKTYLREIGEENTWNWVIELSNNPDKDLATSENVVISADGWIIDRAEMWLNMGRYLFEEILEVENRLVI